MHSSKEILRCFYRLIRCQRFDLLTKYADTLGALGLMDHEIVMAEKEHERLEEHRLTHLKELTDQNWKDGLMVVYPKDEEEEPDDCVPKKKRRKGLIHLGFNFKAKVPRRF